MNSISTKVEVTDPYNSMGWVDREFKETVDEIWEMNAKDIKEILQSVIQEQVHGTPMIQAEVKKFSKKTFACAVAKFEVTFLSKEPQRPDRAPIPRTCIVSFM